MSTKPLAINAEAGQPEYAAIDQRRNQALILMQGVADNLGARPGIRPGGSDAFTLSGTTALVHPAAVVVYPAESSTDGPYIGHLLADSHVLDPADSTQARTDIVQVKVYDDDHDSSGRRELVTEYIAGTPGAGAPDPDDGAWVGLEILVPASGSPSPSAVYVAPYTVAAGGVLPVRTEADLPVAGLYDGLLTFVQDSGTLLVVRDGQWGPAILGVPWVHDQFVHDTSSVTINIPAGYRDEVEFTITGRHNGSSATVDTVNLRINGIDDSVYIRNRTGVRATAFEDGSGGVAAGNLFVGRFYGSSTANLGSSSGTVVMNRNNGDPTAVGRAALTATGWAGRQNTSGSELSYVFGGHLNQTISGIESLTFFSFAQNYQHTRIQIKAWPQMLI